ncbi:MAG: ATP-binding protein [Thermomicrobiales bacterium]
MDVPLHVLLIEDNPGDARLVQVLLSEAPSAAIHLEHADRLATGLNRLATISPDAVLLDLTLPDSQGLDTFDRVQAAAPELPVIVLSGLADEQTAVQAVAAGAQDYLVKGQVDGPTLARALRYAIERRRITAERAALLAGEQAARAGAERLAAERVAILRQIADGVMIVNQQGTITFANLVAQRLYAAAGIALQAGQRIGAFPLLASTGEPYQRDALPLVRALATGEPVVDVEWRLRRPGQPAHEDIWIQGSATPVYSEEDALLGAVLTFRDVTAARAHTRQKEEFFANASHDLRTPLAAIKASIGVVLANEPACVTPPLHRLLVNIDQASSEMARLVDDLLELARLESGQTALRLARHDLRELAQHAVAAIEPLAQTRCQHVELVLPDEAVPVRVDVALLERAILNLLGNAQKYGRNAGLIRLTVARDGMEATIAVTDDGPGIPIEDQGRIFERFYRPATPAVRQVVGSGLGLPIVRMLAERHGGRATLESTPGQGATFRIVLPIDAEGARQ